MVRAGWPAPSHTTLELLRHYEAFKKIFLFVQRKQQIFLLDVMSFFYWLGKDQRTGRSETCARIVLHVTWRAERSSRDHLPCRHVTSRTFIVTCREDVTPRGVCAPQSVPFRHKTDEHTAISPQVILVCPSSLPRNPQQ